MRRLMLVFSETNTEIVQFSKQLKHESSTNMDNPTRELLARDLFVRIQMFACVAPFCFRLYVACISQVRVHFVFSAHCLIIPYSFHIQLVLVHVSCLFRVFVNIPNGFLIYSACILQQFRDFVCISYVFNTLFVSISCVHTYSACIPCLFRMRGV